MVFARFHESANWELAAMKADSIAHLLRRAGQGAEDAFARNVPSMTPRQYAVLVCLNGQDGLSLIDIVERTGIDHSTVADLVLRMAKKDLLQRRRSRDDVRAYEVQLTDAGRQAFRSVAPKARRVDSSILSALQAEQREPFIAALLAIASLTTE